MWLEDQGDVDVGLNQSGCLAHLHAHLDLIEL